ncbi:hypothetical protein ACP70R_045593 [Stipagrostis hirtigluma subsp. patula]
MLDGGRKRSASDAGLATTLTSLSDAADVPFETAKDWKTMEKPKQRVVTVRATASSIFSDPQLDDGYTWCCRGISGGDKFPRLYYYCVHRHSRGCTATKQVQPTDDDPTLVKVFYDGWHTCVTQEHVTPPTPLGVSSPSTQTVTPPSPVQVFPMRSTYEHGACSPPQEPQDMGHSPGELELGDFLIKGGAISEPAGSGASAYSAPTAEDAENPDVQARGAEHRVHNLLEKDTPSPAQPTGCSKMPQQSNTTCAPSPPGLPPPATQHVTPPSTYEPRACSSPQAPKHMGLNTNLTLQEGLNAHKILEMTVAQSRSKPVGIGASAYSAPTAEDAENPDVQARGAEHRVHNLLEKDTPSPAQPTGCSKMPQQSNTTCAPSPPGLPPPATQHVTPPSTYEPRACSSPQAPKHMGLNTNLTLQEGLNAHKILEMTVAQSRSKPVGIGASAYSAPTAEDAEDPDVQARGAEHRVHNLLEKDTPSPAQPTGCSKMPQQSNTTCAPSPPGLPPPATQHVTPPSTYEPRACSSPQAPKHMGLNTNLTLQEGLNAHKILEMTVAQSRSKPVGIGASAYSAPTAEDAEDPDVQARGAEHRVHNLLEKDTPSPAQPTGCSKMPQQSNTTCAPSPPGLPPPATQHVTPPSTYEPRACSSPQAPKHMGLNTNLTLQEGLNAHKILEMTVAQSRSKPVGIGASAYSAPTVEDAEDPHVQARGVDQTFHNFLDTPTHAQAVSNGSSSQSINVGDGTNARDCVRTKKRLSWTEEEDLILVSAWLSHSNDPKKLNYKKNEQFWEAVTAVYNNKIRKERSRKVKQVKDHFEKIKKALKTCEEEHKNDGPFMFEHCWEVLRKEPKWDDYLKRLRDEPQIGGKQAKKQEKRERKEQPSVIDLEDEHDKVVDAQNTANEGHREMLEIQRHVPSENLEARMIARDKDTPETQMNTAKEQNELLKMYYSLTIKDTTGMSKDEKSEHVLALKFFREKLSGKPE